MAASPLCALAHVMANILQELPAERFMCATAPKVFQRKHLIFASKAVRSLLRHEVGLIDHGSGLRLSFLVSSAADERLEETDIMIKPPENLAALPPTAEAGFVA